MSTLYTLTTLADTVGHWRFQGNLLDISGNANHFTGSGVDSSDYFTGYTESGTTTVEIYNPDIAIIAAPASDFEMSTLDFTIEMIVKAPAGSISDALDKFSQAGVDYSGWRVIFNGSGGSWAFQGGDGSAPNVTCNTSALDPDTWYYLAWTIDRTTDLVTPYVNGTAETAVSITGVGSLSLPAENLTLYTIIDDIVFDEICITKRALTTAEIAVRAGGHGAPRTFTLNDSIDELSNVVTTTTDAFDIQLIHTCNHLLSGVQYTLDACPRCLGTGAYYDIHFDETGKSAILSVEDKLEQSLEKIILTENNPFHEDLGSHLRSRMGAPVQKVIGIIKYDIIQAVATLQINQQGVPNLSSRARIARLDDISVIQTAVNSLQYIVKITTVSGEKKELSGVIRLSGTQE